MIDGPSGKYRFLATFQKGARGGRRQRRVLRGRPRRNAQGGNGGRRSGATTPSWRNGSTANGIKTRAFAAGTQTFAGSDPGGQSARCGRRRGVPRAGPAHRPRLACGLSRPRGVQEGRQDSHLLAAAGEQGQRRNRLDNWLYHKDDWAKNHPIFDGLPAGCILDHTFYREVISERRSGRGRTFRPRWWPARSTRPCGYGSGLTVAVYKLGAGRFTLNTLRIRENLGSDPVAERLLRNMLRHAARDAGQPPADLPGGFRGATARPWGTQSPSTVRSEEYRAVRARLESVRSWSLSLRERARVRALLGETIVPYYSASPRPHPQPLSQRERGAFPNTL